jgi:tetratricopeptide (TPR) repeat protein
MPEVVEEYRREPSRALRLLLSWQLWLFAIAVWAGTFMYVLHPEPAATRGDLSPAEIYRRGREMGREALARDDVSAERLGLLLGARTYLSVLEQTYSAAAEMNDLPLLLGRVYYALGDVAMRSPQTAKRERLLKAEESFRRAARLLSEATERYPVELPEGVSARRYCGEALLQLGDYSAATASLATVVDAERAKAREGLLAERTEGVVMWPVPVSQDVEDVTSAYVNTLWLSGRRDEAVQAAEELLPMVTLPVNRSALIAVQGRAHIGEGPEYWDSEAGRSLAEELRRPVTPEVFRLAVLLALKMGKLEDALALMALDKRPVLGELEETILRGLATALQKHSGAEIKALVNVPPAITLMLDRARLVALAEAGLANGRPDDAAPYFQALAKERPPAEPVEYLPVVGDERTISIGERLARALALAKERSAGAEVYRLLSDVPGADGAAYLQQAAFLYEEAGGDGRTEEARAMYWKAAETVERLLAYGPPADMVEKLYWRAVDDWGRSGDMLRTLLLLERVTSDLPNIQSMPRLLYELGRGYQKTGLFEKAVEVHARNFTAFPDSSYAMFGLLEKARAAAAIPHPIEARRYYLDVLGEGRLSPEAFTYMAALFEAGELEVQMLAAEYRPGAPLDEELHNAAQKHLVEALERYTLDDYKGFPFFYRYLAIDGRPTAWLELSETTATHSKEALTQAESGAYGRRASAWVELMRLYFMGGNYSEVLRIAELALPEMPSQKMEDVPGLLRDYLLLKGVSGALASQQMRQSGKAYAAAEEAFGSMRDMYIRRGEAAWALLAMAILGKSRGDRPAEVNKLMEEAGWAFSVLAGDESQKYAFWQNVSNWLSAYQGGGKK